MDDEVNNGTAHEKGAEGFVEKWRLESDVRTQVSDLWIVLRHLLKYGGVLNDRQTRFVGPYYQALYPAVIPGDTTGVIIGSGVRIRSAPNSASKILATLSYNIIDIIDENGPEESIGGETHPWYKVRLKDDTEGFAYGKFIGRPNENRLVLQKIRGAWRIVELAEGKK